MSLFRSASLFGNRNSMRISQITNPKSPIAITD